MSDTVAILTPPGRSALATVAAAGPGVWEVVRRHFRPTDRKALPEVPVEGRFRLGRLGADLADEVVLAVIGLDPVRLEIHGHGGEEVVRCLVELFAGACREELTPRPPLRRGEGEQEASGKASRPPSDFLPPLPAGEGAGGDEVFAARLLPYTTTMRTASIVLDQLAGAFAREIDAARRAIDAGQIPAARAILEELAKRRNVGRHVVEPFRVAIAGAPNVGKSSLANAIAGYQRSIVSPIPGTTRDLVSTHLAVEGWPIVLTDTAGIRFAAEDLEGQGIERARGAVAEADVVLWVLDASADPVWPEPPIPNLLVVLNKIDLPPAWDVSEVEACRVSAATGEGVADLLVALADRLVPKAPPPGGGVPLTAEETHAIEEMLRAIA